MRARQEAVELTRLRITEATMRLHEAVGPAATTVSAIAAEAGVTRLTVYRHFPDEEAIVRACSGHWRALHPSPDPDRWAETADPVARLRAALSETYAWNVAAAPMQTMIFRDLDTMPAFVQAALASDARTRVAVLAKGFATRGRRSTRVSAAIAHALRITTWQSLCVDGGLRDEEAVDLMSAAVQAAAR